MKHRIGRTAAVVFLCVAAATVGLWSGPLSAASGSLHAAAASPAHAAATHSTR